MTALALATSVGAGLVAGILLAFSGFVMRALQDLPVPAGVAAMQRINVHVLNPVIMGAFFGTGLGALALGGVGIARLADGQVGPGLCWLVGAGAYLLGVLWVTGRRNVPLNDRLAALPADGTAAAAFWPDYCRRWVRWNHVRVAGGALAALLLPLGLIP